MASLKSSSVTRFVASIGSFVLVLLVAVAIVAMPRAAFANDLAAGSGVMAQGGMNWQHAKIGGTFTAPADIEYPTAYIHLDGIDKSGMITMTFANDESRDIASGVIAEYDAKKKTYFARKDLANVNVPESGKKTYSFKAKAGKAYYVEVYTTASAKFHFSFKYADANGKPEKASIANLKAEKKAFLVKWSKVKGASKYQVRYSVKANMAKSKSVQTKATSKKIAKLKSGKKYYVQVRAASNVGGKTVWSDWSARKSVKTK